MVDDAETQRAEEIHLQITEKVLLALSGALGQTLRFRTDRQLIDEIAEEARPAIQSLLLALDMESGDDETSLDFHEGVAMTMLLGRRVALLGATPGASVGLSDALRMALEEIGPLPGALFQALREACAEGFVRGREEHLQRAWAEQAALAIPTLRIGPQSLALVLTGTHEPEVLEEVVEAFVRQLFRSEAVAAIIDVSGLVALEAGQVAAILGAASGAAIVGATLCVSGVDSEWLEFASARRKHFDPDLHFESFEDALKVVHDAEGVALRRPLPSMIRGLLRKSG